MRNMNVVFDGIGYVNNRGKSKYWGVSEVFNCPGQWRICYNNFGENVTYLYSDELRGSSEEFTARLAAHLYQFRFKTLPSFVDVEVDGKYYRLDSIGKQIYRLYGEPSYLVTIDGQVDSKGDNDFDLDVSLNQTNLSEKDKKVIGYVFDNLINDHMSDRGKLVLKEMINILTQ